MKKLLLIPLIVFCLNLSAAEYGYLQIEQNESITILDGDLLEVIGYKIPNGSNKAVFQFTLSGVQNYLFLSGEYPKIVGPATISLLEETLNWSSLQPSPYLFYKLTRASEVKTVTNSITIPAIADQEWAVTLERSTDLTNWETVAPGTVTGTDSLQFFRLRVGGETTTVESTSTGGE